MKVGFSGTRTGMSGRQISRLHLILHRLWKEEGLEELHHGDCLGADLQAHLVAYQDYEIPIWLHPPIKPNLRAYCEKNHEGVIGSCEPDEYLTRNRHIVDETDLLIGAPLSRGVSWRGGTWYTIDYAVKMGKPVFKLYPNGDMELSPEAMYSYGKLFADA